MIETKLTLVSANGMSAFVQLPVERGERMTGKGEDVKVKISTPARMALFGIPNGACVCPSWGGPIGFRRFG